MLLTVRLADDENAPTWPTGRVGALSVVLGVSRHLEVADGAGCSRLGGGCSNHLAELLTLPGASPHPSGWGDVFMPGAGT